MVRTLVAAIAVALAVPAAALACEGHMQQAKNDASPVLLAQAEKKPAAKKKKGAKGKRAPTPKPGEPKMN